MKDFYSLIKGNQLGNYFDLPVNETLPLARLSYRNELSSLKNANQDTLLIWDAHLVYELDWNKALYEDKIPPSKFRQVYNISRFSDQSMLREDFSNQFVYIQLKDAATSGSNFYVLRRNYDNVDFVSTTKTLLLLYTGPLILL